MKADATVLAVDDEPRVGRGRARRARRRAAGGARARAGTATSRRLVPRTARARLASRRASTPTTTPTTMQALLGHGDAVVLVQEQVHRARARCTRRVRVLYNNSEDDNPHRVVQNANDAAIRPTTSTNLASERRRRRRSGRRRCRRRGSRRCRWTRARRRGGRRGRCCCTRTAGTSAYSWARWCASSRRCCCSRGAPSAAREDGRRPRRAPTRPRARQHVDVAAARGVRAPLARAVGDAILARRSGAPNGQHAGGGPGHRLRQAPRARAVLLRRRRVPAQAAAHARGAVRARARAPVPERAVRGAHAASAPDGRPAARRRRGSCSASCSMEGMQVVDEGRCPCGCWASGARRSASWITSVD